MEVILGTMTFGYKDIEEEVALRMSKLFVASGGYNFDSAFLYEDGKSEEILGRCLPVLRSQFPTHRPLFISTKANPWAGSGNSLKAESVLHQVNTSLQRLGVSQVDLLYLHAPDYTTPVEETLAACQQLYREGKFKELGLSNYAAWQVVDIYHICKHNGWVLPTVYQGMYNAITRDVERELLPAIRRLNMRFYAFNPLAGGLLTGKYRNFNEKPTDGRFVWRPNYISRYWRDSSFEALSLMDNSVTTHNISHTDAAFRWLFHHSQLRAGDGIIVGASNLQQLEQNLQYCFAAAAATTITTSTMDTSAATTVSPTLAQLPSDVVKAYNDAWELVKGDCVPYFKLP